MEDHHQYTCQIRWTGNRGEGTRAYGAYDRTWDISTPKKTIIHCSNDPLLGGDASKPNPEDLLLSSLSACHMLWYLHLASEAKQNVIAYSDQPVGIGEVTESGAGRFLNVTLHPQIVLTDDADQSIADELHHRVHDVCFIARSVNFPVTCKASYRFESSPGVDLQ